GLRDTCDTRLRMLAFEPAHRCDTGTQRNVTDPQADNAVAQIRGQIVRRRSNHFVGTDRDRHCSSFLAWRSVYSWAATGPTAWNVVAHNCVLRDGFEQLALGHVGPPRDVVLLRDGVELFSCQRVEVFGRFVFAEP